METQPDLQHITEVKEVHTTAEANKLLSSGWLLLAVIQEAKFYHEGSDYSRPVYILGLPHDLDTRISK